MKLGSIVFYRSVVEFIEQSAIETWFYCIL